MNKTLKDLIDFVSYTDFFGVCIDHYASFIAWEYLFETRCTIAIILF